MKLVTSSNGIVIAIYEDYQNIEELYPDDTLILIDQEPLGIGDDASSLIDDDTQWNRVRNYRNGLLKNSDIYVSADIWEAMSIKDKDAWAVYRQELRDITTQKDPKKVKYPKEPKNIPPGLAKK